LGDAVGSVLGFVLMSKKESLQALLINATTADRNIDFIFIVKFKFWWLLKIQG
jgi:hypothetical protein